MIRNNFKISVFDYSNHHFQNVGPPRHLSIASLFDLMKQKLPWINVAPKNTMNKW